MDWPRIVSIFIHSVYRNMKWNYELKLFLMAFTDVSRQFFFAYRVFKAEVHAAIDHSGTRFIMLCPLLIVDKSHCLVQWNLKIRSLQNLNQLLSISLSMMAICCLVVLKKVLDDIQIFSYISDWLHPKGNANSNQWEPYRLFLSLGIVCFIWSWLVAS